jgi:hypothetical protein
VVNKTNYQSERRPSRLNTLHWWQKSEVSVRNKSEDFFQYKCLNREFHNLYSSTNIIRGKAQALELLLGNPDGMRQTNLGAGGILLKWIGGSGLDIVCLRTETSCGTSVSIKYCECVG